MPASLEFDACEYAIQKEFETTANAKTYEEVNGSPNIALPFGLTLKLKRDRGGRPDKFRARIVARVNKQEFDEGPFESRYASVASSDLVRIFLSLLMALEWIRHRVDVEGAFLYSDLPKKD